MAILKNSLFLPRFISCVNVNISGKLVLLPLAMWDSDEKGVGWGKKINKKINKWKAKFQRYENRKKKHKTIHQHCYKSVLPKFAFPSFYQVPGLIPACKALYHFGRWEIPTPWGGIRSPS